MADAIAASLTIDTIKGLQEDFPNDEAPFLLAMVQGAEGISMPFAYDVTMFRPESLPDVDPADLINTQATISIKVKSDTWIRRRGMIASLAKSGTSNVRHEAQRNFYVYTAHIVPAFKMLDNETTFRIFENMSLPDIFKEVLSGFPSIPNIGAQNYVDFSQLAAADTPAIPYCVQFAESSFNFLSRLMAQFGIWYIFDHRYDREQAVNETMVLGKSLGLIQQCDQDQMKIVLYDAKKDAIAAFSRAYTPSHHHVWVADFNESNPTEPPAEPATGGDADVSTAFDLQPNEPKFSSRYHLDQFPNNANDAEILMRSEEAGVFVASGQSQNRTFVAGRTFQVSEDETGAAGSGKTYLITALSFVCYENSYGHSTGWDLLNLLGDFTWKPFTPEGKRALNVIGNLATQGLSNYLQNWGPWALKFNLPNNGGSTLPGFPNFFGGGLIAAGAAAVQNLFDGIDHIIHRHEDKYGNAFVAVPSVLQSGMWRMPLPSAKSPTVNGPHLAVVLGTDGTEESQRGCIYTNDKGQVRIRFGWQRTVPLAPPAYSPDPLKSDQRAAWVRVSEGWAGRTYGTQMLPRIGDEVIVNFIDGDPSRPIITGRVYNDYAPHVFDTTNGAARSGIKTQSLPAQGATAGSSGTPGYHLLRFDDTSGNEQLLLRSQGRMDVTANASHYETTIGNKHNLCIAGIDKTGTITYDGSMFTTTGKPHFGIPPNGNYDLHVGGSRYEQVDGVDGYQLSVKKDVQLNLQQNCTGVVQGVLSLSASSIVLQAAQKITLKVGSTTIVLNSGGVWLDGPQVNKQQGGPADQAGAVTIKDVIDAVQADPGEPANSRAGGSGGGGGGASNQRGQTTILPPDPLNANLDQDNMLSVPP